MNLPVVIVGAGPVGLTLALLLHQRNIPVEVYEAVSELKPLGVGINLLPHSVRVLYGLGLEKQLDRIAIRTSALHYYNKFGQTIWQEPRGLAAGYQFPQFSIHRGDLQLMLLEAVRSTIGRECVRSGHRMLGWQDTAEGVAVKFATAAGEQPIRGRCLIAADGIKSTARNTLYPNEGDPIYGGRILWRGVTVTKPFLDGRTMFMAGHQDRKFVAYPIKNLPDGKALINWIAELREPNWQKQDQDWNREVSPSVFAPDFADWHFGWIDIPKIIANCEHVFEFPLSDRNPLPRWSHGHMTLTGDAAHPMYPIGSNGASQGILDAEKLAVELAQQPDIQQAFAAYESERRPATANIVLLNRKNGPEQVMQLAEDRAPHGFDNIETVIPRTELEAIAAQYKQTAGFTVETVNTKAKSSQ